MNEYVKVSHVATVSEEDLQWFQFYIARSTTNVECVCVCGGGGG